MFYKKLLDDNLKTILSNDSFSLIDGISSDKLILRMIDS